MKKSIWRILTFALALLLAVQIPVQAVSADTEPQQDYYPNTGELQEAAFIQLPMGAVQAEEWLLQQLYL